LSIYGGGHLSTYLLNSAIKGPKIVHHFKIPKAISTKKNATQKVEASILIPWGFIVSIAHFPGSEGFDFPSPFDSEIGF